MGFFIFCFDLFFNPLGPSQFSPPSTALLEDWSGLQADVLALSPGAKVPPDAILVLYDGGGGSRGLPALRSCVKTTGYSGGMTADDG